MSSLATVRRAVATAIHSAPCSHGVRGLSSNAVRPSEARPVAPLTPGALSNPLNASDVAGGQGLNMLARPGGRQSVSGIVATVFGASGFLGRHVVNNLGRIGSQVLLPYRDDGMKIRSLKMSGDLGQMVPIPYDLRDVASIRRAVQRSNVVINLVGSSVETSHYGYDDVNAKVAYRLAQVAKACGVERFIHVSCMGADAQSPSAYFRSKAAGEAAVRDFYPDATIVRPSVMFGAQDKFLSYYAYMGHKLAAVPITRNGERRLQPVFVGDVARALLNSIADPSSKGQLYELAGSDVYTEQQILDLVAKHTFGPIRAYNMSDLSARLYGALVGGRRSFPTDLHWGEAGSVARGTSFVLNTVGQFVNKMSLPSIYHPDMVAQAHTDLVASGRLPGLSALGVETPMPLNAQIDRVLFPHRLEQPNRFPEAEKMKRDAADVASY